MSVSIFMIFTAFFCSRNRECDIVEHIRKEEQFMKKYSLYLIPLYILYLGIYYYVALPPFNWHAPEFWRFLIFGFGPLLIILLLSSLTIRGIQGARDFGSMFHRNVVNAGEDNKKWKTITRVCLVAIAVIILFPCVMYGINVKVFHAKEYANRINIKNVEFSEVPEVDFTKTPIIDRDSSIRLGDKVMGNMTEWVSQFDVSQEYTQISYKDSVYRVTPLTYNGIIKYFKNRGNGIPAYITVDSTNGKTELVKLKDLGLGGMKYVPSAMFNENLMRKIRFQHPTEIFGSPSFEIDEQGHPWYICSTYTYKGVGAKKQVTGAIFLDPITGESTKYEAGNIPSWADRVFPESLLVQELDDNGSLQDGFINSVFGQKGVTVTSEGYNYLEKDGDIWLYSGITSVNSDESNLGFVLVNMRTHEAMKIATAGANETSAMKSAEAEVKNYGYQSTFPLLINLNGNPVYLMSLKDNGLIKMYAMVSAIDYQKVATISSDESFESLAKSMLNVLDSLDENINPDQLKEADITVSAVEKVNLEGTTWYYIESESKDIFKVAFQSRYEDTLVFLKKGDVLHISYVDNEGIKQIKGIE